MFFQVQQRVRPAVAIQRRTTNNGESLRQIEAQSRFIGFVNVKAHGSIVRRGQTGAGMLQQRRANTSTKDGGIEK